MATEFLKYRELPLVRCGNDIYYGDMSQKYVIKMSVQQTTEAGNTTIPTKVLVQLMYTDPDIRAKDRVIKTSEKESLSKALEISEVWLKKALKD